MSVVEDVLINLRDDNGSPCARSIPSFARLGERLSVALVIVVLSACGGSEALAPVQDAGDLAARQPMGEVQSGDTLYSFAWRYGSDYREIARWNGLGPPYRVQAGERLRLSPGGAVTRPSTSGAALDSANVVAARPPPTLPDPAKAAPESTPKPNATPPPESRPQPAPSAPVTVVEKAPAPAPTKTPSSSNRQTATRWYWPVDGKVVQRFNLARPGGQGIRIAARPDASVVAARSGKVVYVGGGLPGYGKLIIVKHSQDLLTAYGYLDRAFVKEGEQVEGGQSIATVAGNGAEDTPTLHFEVRRDGKPTDPLVFLSG